MEVTLRKMVNGRWRWQVEAQVDSKTGRRPIGGAIYNKDLPDCATLAEAATHAQNWITAYEVSSALRPEVD